MQRSVIRRKHQVITQCHDVLILVKTFDHQQKELPHRGAVRLIEFDKTRHAGHLFCEANIFYSANQRPASPDSPAVFNLYAVSRDSRCKLCSCAPKLGYPSISLIVNRLKDALNDSAFPQRQVVGLS